MNDIHPSALIGEGVELGSGNTIGPFVVIAGPAVIGDGNWIGAGVVIGAPPEVRSFEHRQDADSPGRPAGVTIGSRNVIREYAQIHQGWKTATIVGDDTFIMNQVYVAHDGRIGNSVTLASSVLLAGHVSIGEGANLGMGATVHQFRSVGAGTMIGMSSVVTKDMPPFALAYGNPARVRGANRIGLQRAGAGVADIAALDSAYANDEAVDVAGLSLPAHLARAFPHTSQA